ncbi:MAG: hypothetical protein ACLQO1_01685 [Steroidobacteraceae bacterium]
MRIDRTIDPPDVRAAAAEELRQVQAEAMETAKRMTTEQLEAALHRGSGSSSIFASLRDQIRGIVFHNTFKLEFENRTYAPLPKRLTRGESWSDTQGRVIHDN